MCLCHAGDPAWVTPLVLEGGFAVPGGRMAGGPLLPHLSKALNLQYVTSCSISLILFLCVTGGPAWVTPLVLEGGFAVPGGRKAGGPLLPHIMIQIMIQICIETLSHNESHASSVYDTYATQVILRG